MYIPDVIPEADRKIIEEKYRHNTPKEVVLGEHPALLVVDMTYGFVDDRFPTGYSKTGEPCLRNIRKLIDASKSRGLQVIYTRDMSDPEEVYRIHRGAWNFKSRPTNEEVREEYNTIHRMIEPKSEDIVIQKSKPSAFFGTPLVAMLNYLGVDSIILTGMVTSGCVRASALDAFSYNYRVTVPIECVADRSQISHEVTLFDLDAKYANVISLEKTLQLLEKHKVTG